MADWTEIARRAVAAVAPAEREGAIVYLDARELAAGAALRVDGREQRLPWAAAIAFVDLEPGKNWSHRCRYLAVRLDGDEVASYEAGFPPFLTQPAPALRVVWEGPLVPAWVSHRD